MGPCRIDVRSARRPVVPVRTSTAPQRVGNVIPGVLSATAIWTVASIGFSIYVSSFGRYNETYGTLGAAVVLLLWFWFTSLAILLGAELNEALTLDRERASERNVVEEE